MGYMGSMVFGECVRERKYKDRKNSFGSCESYIMTFFGLFVSVDGAADTFC